MTVINTSGYDVRNIEGWDDLDIYTEMATQITSDHEERFKTDEEIIREIERLMLQQRS